MSGHYPDGVTGNEPHIAGHVERDATRSVECDDCESEEYEVDGIETLAVGEILFEGECPYGHHIERAFPIEDEREYDRSDDE